MYGQNWYIYSFFFTMFIKNIYINLFGNRDSKINYVNV